MTPWIFSNVVSDILEVQYQEECIFFRCRQRELSFHINIKNIGTNAPDTMTILGQLRYAVDEAIKYHMACANALLAFETDVKRRYEEEQDANATLPDKAGE